MKAATYLIACATVLGFTTLANAEDEFESTTYGGLEYGQYDLSFGGLSAEPEGIRARVGYRWSEHFAVEAFYGLGAKEDERKVNGVDVDVDLNDTYGIYLRGILPMGEKANVYGIVGYSSIEVDNFIGPTASGSKDSVSDSDYGYGVAADYNVFKQVFLSLEYMRMLDGDKIEADVLNAGIRVNFE